MKTLTVKIPELLMENIAGAARKRNVTRSEIIRERLALTPGAEANATASLWDRMEDLVIREEPLPSDLSSNRAHMADYGKSRSD